jgi:hypothetical protein
MVIIDKYAKFDQRHYVLEYHTMMAGCTTCIKILDSFNMGSLSKKYKEHVFCHK